MAIKELNWKSRGLRYCKNFQGKIPYFLCYQKKNYFYAKKLSWGVKFSSPDPHPPRNSAQERTPSSEKWLEEDKTENSILTRLQIMQLSLMKTSDYNKVYSWEQNIYFQRPFRVDTDELKKPKIWPKRCWAV